MSMPESGSLANLAKDYQARNPTPRELETMAWTEVNKHAMGIVKDALERLISDVDREGLFKYDTGANKPLLDHPLNRLRMAANLIGGDDDSWKNVALSLGRYLPEEVKERLSYELGLSFNDRDLSYQELNNTLTFVAKALVWAEAVTSPFVDKVTLARTYLNTAMPTVALREIVTQGDQLYATANSYLNAVGHNHPQFDLLMNYLAQVGDALQELKDLAQVLEQGSPSFDKKRNLAHLANQLSALDSLFHHTDVGSDLRILGPTISAMATVTAALSLSKGSPSLAIGMHLASIGLNSNNSALGLIGNAFYNTSNAITSGVLTSMTFGANAEVREMQQLRAELTDIRENGMQRISTGNRAILSEHPDVMLKLNQYGVHPPMIGGGPYDGHAKKLAQEGTPPYDNPIYRNMAMSLPGGWEELSSRELNQTIAQLDQAIEQKQQERIPFIDPGAALFFPNAVNIGLLGVATAAVIVTDYGFGLLPNHDYKDRLYSTELALNLAYSTNFARDTFGILARAAGADSRTEDLVADILAMIAMLMAILAAAKGEPEGIERLGKHMKDDLEDGLDKIETYLNDQINEGSIKSDSAIGLHMHLLQARNALENEDMMGLIHSYTSALELVGVSEQMLNKGLGEIRELAETFVNAFTGGLDDLTNTNTGIFQG